MSGHVMAVSSPVRVARQLTVPEVAELLGYSSRDPVYKLMHDAGLPYRLIRGVRRVPEDELAAWLERQPSTKSAKR